MVRLEELSSADFGAPVVAKGARRLLPLPTAPAVPDPRRPFSGQPVVAAHSAADDGAAPGPSRKRAAVEPKKAKRSKPLSVGEAAFDVTPKLQLRSLPVFSNPTPSPVAKVSTKRLARPLASPPRADRFQRDSPKRTPTKPVSAFISDHATALFDAIKAPVVAETREWSTGHRLSEMIPLLPATTVEWEGEPGADMWSPQKKKRGYKVAGLASLASTVLASAKTEHTLWIHELSRTLAAHQATPLTRPLLAKLLQPVICLRVVEILKSGAVAASDLTPQLSVWEESRVVTAQCAIVMDGNAGDDDQQGLVVFSLHNRPPTSTLTATVTKSLQRKPPGDRSERLAVFVPSTPHDLRHLEPGVDVWVWGTPCEVVLSPPTVVAPPADLAERIIEDVFWDARPAAVRAEEATKGEHYREVQRALVCSQFGVIIG